MSRDAPDARGAQDAPDMRGAADRPAPRVAPQAPGDLDDAEAKRAARTDAGALLSAYVDGIAELAIDERRGVETWLDGEPAARDEAAAVQGMLGRLRALPPEHADEPDWSAMERSIRLAVADAPIRRWWQSWRWLVPAMTFATAAALLFALWPRTEPGPERVRPKAGSAERLHPAPAPPPPAADRPEAADERATVALWLDGAVVDVDLSTPAARDLIREEAPGGAGLGEPSEIALPAEAEAGVDAPEEGGLLPAADLAWVDGLDDAALARAERWLADRPGQASPDGQGPAVQGAAGKKG